jgi:undecaprenyl-diphosphatase
MVSFLEQIVLGFFQGIVEWLPFSSEGVLLFVKSVFFHQDSINMELFLRQALFLHLGTFFAALIYFWKDVKSLCREAFHYKQTDMLSKKTINFLAIATIVTTVMGGILFFAVLYLDKLTESVITSRIVALLVGGLLLITGLTQLKASRKGIRQIIHLNKKDSLFAGFMQGLAAFPGLSRSGLTISSMLFRKINETTALKLSFLMSLPVILIGNTASILFQNPDLGISSFQIMSGMIFGFLTSFAFGYLTIHGLMKISKKIRFGWFVILMASLIILSGILIPR